ncbi:MAG: hypothetical protein WCS65_17285 [Verrucomicrobiae bacterium]
MIPRFLLCILLACAALQAGQLCLPEIFSDGMVLQEGKLVITSGPLAQSARQIGGSIAVSFTEAEGVNVPDGIAPGQFEASGDAGEFVKVSGKLDGGKWFCPGRAPEPPRPCAMHGLAFPWLISTTQKSCQPRHFSSPSAPGNKP